MKNGPVEYRPKEPCSVGGVGWGWGVGGGGALLWQLPQRAPIQRGGGLGVGRAPPRQFFAPTPKLTAAEETSACLFLFISGCCRRNWVLGTTRGSSLAN